MSESLSQQMQRITKVFTNFSEVIMFGSSTESWERRAATSLAASQRRRRDTKRNPLGYGAALVAIPVGIAVLIVAVLLIITELYQ